jgi:hypothetical protein
MRISVRGWGRDLGGTEMVSGDLRAAATIKEGESYWPDKLYKKVLNPGDRRRTRVRVSTNTEVRLRGKYLLRLERQPKGNNRTLFRNPQRLNGSNAACVCRGGAYEDYVQSRARIAEMEERRRTRLAEENASE